MDAERMQRALELFESVLSLPPKEQAEFLAAANNADPELCAEVESLIEHDRQADASFMADSKPPMAVVPVVGRDNSETIQLGAVRTGRAITVEIEGYTILRELNRGGQGIVYEAKQQATKRTVAIKVLLEGGYSTMAAKKRFEREIELVAQLKHPNIISVFHSGSTRDGHPFYVMDYVDGEPLGQFVREGKLTLEVMLELFGVICDAVQYAHQKGVIHRDLKPANIIVDHDGTPRILDFGLAKPLIAQTGSLISITQEIVGTLPYMSPEQAGGNATEVDTRTDVYSLGVILYELLTGHRPYPVEGKIPDVLRHITETPPTPPSRSWTCDAGITQRTTRRLRIGECPIDADVETIVFKALAKDAERRYQSAGELARDTRHYLAGEPIEARSDSIVYVLWKQSRQFLRRAPVVALAIFCAILTPGLVVSLLFWRDAVKERDIAEAAIGFLNNDVFKSLDPKQAGRAVDLKELLDVASHKVDERFADAPLAEASVRQTLGNFYGSLGDNQNALSHLERALRLRETQLGENHPAVAETLANLSPVLESLGHGAEAERQLQDALAIRSRSLGEQDPLTVNTLAQLAAIVGRQGDLEREAILRSQLPATYVAETLPLPEAGDLAALRKRLQAARREHGESHPEVATCLVQLADRLADQSAYADAAPLYLQAQRIWNEQFGPECPQARKTFVKLEKLFLKMGAPERIVPRLAARLERVLGSRDNAPLLSSAAWDVVKFPWYPASLFATAFKAAEEACRLEPGNGAHTNTLGVALYRTGRYEEALQVLQRSNELNGGHPADIAFLAMTQSRLGRAALAQEELKKLRSLVSKHPWATDPQTLQLVNEARSLIDSEGE